MATVEGRSLFMNNIIPLLELLPEGVFKQMMLQQIEKLTGLPVASIESKLTSGSRPSFKRLPLHKTEVGGMTKISWMIAMLLKQPNLAMLIENPEVLEKSNAPGVDTLFKLIESIKLAPNSTTAQILERWRETKFSKRFHELSTFQLFDDDNIDLKDAFRDALGSIEAEMATPYKEAKTTTLQDASEELKSKLKNLQK